MSEHPYADHTEERANRQQDEIVELSEKDWKCAGCGAPAPGSGAS